MSVAAFTSPHNYIPSVHKTEDACFDASCIAKLHRKELSPAEFRCDSRGHYVENSLQDREGRLLNTWMVKWQNPLNQLRRESLSEIQQAHNAIIRAVSSAFRIYVNPTDITFHLINSEETRILLASASTDFSGKTISLLDADSAFLPAGYEKTVHGAMKYLSQDVLKQPDAEDQPISPLPLRSLKWDSDYDRIGRIDPSGAQRKGELRSLTSKVPQIHSESQTEQIPENNLQTSETQTEASSEINPPLPLQDPYNPITRKYIDFIDNGPGNWAEKAGEFQVDFFRNENGSGFVSFESILGRNIPGFGEALKQLADGVRSGDLDRLDQFLVSMYQRTLQFWIENLKIMHGKTFNILRSRHKSANVEDIKKVYYKIHAARNLLIAFEASKQLSDSQRINLLIKLIKRN